jgi:hypothetical protein
VHGRRSRILHCDGIFESREQSGLVCHRPVKYPIFSRCSINPHVNIAIPIFAPRGSVELTNLLNGPRFHREPIAYLTLCSVGASGCSVLAVHLYMLEPDLSTVLVRCACAPLGSGSRVELRTVNDRPPTPWSVDPALPDLERSLIYSSSCTCAILESQFGGIWSVNNGVWGEAKHGMLPLSKKEDQVFISLSLCETGPDYSPSDLYLGAMKVGLNVGIAVSMAVHVRDTDLMRSFATKQERSSGWLRKRPALHPSVIAHHLRQQTSLVS